MQVSICTCSPCKHKAQASDGFKHSIIGDFFSSLGSLWCHRDGIIIQSSQAHNCAAEPPPPYCFIYTLVLQIELISFNLNKKHILVWVFSLDKLCHSLSLTTWDHLQLSLHFVIYSSLQCARHVIARMTLDGPGANDWQLFIPAETTGFNKWPNQLHIVFN